MIWIAVFIPLIRLNDSLSDVHERLEADLTYTTLGAYLEGAPPVQAIALFDVKDRAAPGNGWRLLLKPAAHADLRLGNRAGSVRNEIFGGGGSSAVTCRDGANAPDGKAIWPLADGEVVRALSFCWRGRLDHDALWQVAVPATLHLDERLTAPQIGELNRRIAEQKDVFAWYRPQVQIWTHECKVTLPYLWQAEGYARDDWIPLWIEAQVARRFAALLADLPHDLTVDDGYSSTYVMNADPATGLSEDGLAEGTPYFRLRDPNGSLVVPGLSLFRPVLRLSGTAEACARFDSVDVADLAVPFRDMAMLTAAIAAGKVDPNSGGALTDADALRDPVLERQTTEEITYPVNFIEGRPPVAQP